MTAAEKRKTGTIAGEEDEAPYEHATLEAEIHATESTEIDEAATTMKSLRRVYYGRYGDSSISDAAKKSYEAVEISLVLVKPFPVTLST